MASRPGWQVWTSHVLAVLAALMMLMAGGSKLVGDPAQVAGFAGYGFPGWFVYFTGLLEVSGAVLLLIPRTRLFGAMVVILVMIGAAMTHLLSAETGRVPMPVIVGLVAGLSAYLTLPRRIG